MSGNRLAFGISEDRDYEWPAIQPSAFSREGRYQTAVALLDKLLAKPSTEDIHKRYWDRALQSGTTLPAKDYDNARLRHRSDIHWIMIYEAEHGRIWNDGPPDYMTAERDYHRTADRDAARLKSIIKDLRQIDRKHAYLLRNCLSCAMQDFLSADKVRRAHLPNVNVQSGYELKTISGPAIRHSEFQYLSKLSLFHFDELLDSFEREVNQSFRPWLRAWKEFGPLRFDHQIDPRSAAKMNVVQLGLMAKLSSRMRDFTNGHGIWAYGTGQPIPSHGRPCWGIVAEFINCALDLQNPLTGETAQRIWNKFFEAHRPSMQAWPKPAKREPQAQKL